MKRKRLSRDPVTVAGYYEGMLSRLLRIRQDRSEDLNELGIDMVDRAIYACMLEVDEGAKREGRKAR